MVKNFLSFGIIEGLSRAINWVLLLTLAAILPASEYGVLSLVIAIETLAIPFLLLGQDRSVLRFFRDDKLRASGVLRQIVYLWLLLSFCLIFVAVVYLWLTGQHSIFSLTIMPYAYIFLFSLVILGFIKINLSIIRVESDIKGFAVFRLGHQLLRAFVLIVVMMIYADADYYPGVSVVTALIIAVPYLPGFIRRCSFTEWQPGYGRLISFGAPLIMHVLSGSVLAYIDRFMINHYYDESSVGVYTLGYMLGSSITLLFGLTATYFEPYIYGKKVTSSSGIEYSLGVYSRVLFFLVSASGLVVLVFSHFYLTKVFGDDFGAAVNIVPVVLYAHIFNIVYLQGNYRLTAHEKTGVIAISTFIASVINVVVNMLLIPRLGIMGAAYATFISYIFLSVFMFFLSYKKAGVADHGSRDVMLYGSVLFVFISGVMLNELIYYCSGLFLIILMFSYRIYKDDAQMLRRIFMH